MRCGEYFIEDNTIQYSTVEIIFENTLHPLFTPDLMITQQEVYLRLKKNLNASRPSEHPLVRGKNVNTFRWDYIGCKYKPLHGIKTGSTMGVTLGQQYNTG